MDSGWNKLSFLLLLLLLLSCSKKENTITIQGKVLEKATGSPIAEVNVQLYANGVVGGIYQSNYSYIAGTKTTNDGSFYLQIPKEKYNLFQLRFLKHGYFNEVFSFSFDAMNQSNFEHLQFMQAILPVVFHVKNVTPFDQDDKLVLMTNQIYDCQECCGRTSFLFLGTQVDSIVTCLSVRSVPLVLHVSIEKNKHQWITVDTIFSTNVDTLYHFIEY